MGKKAVSCPCRNYDPDYRRALEGAGEAAWRPQRPLANREPRRPRQRG